MSIVFDLIIVAIVFVTLYTVIKRGFIKTVIDLVSVFVSIILAKMFSPKLSEYLFGVFGERFTDKLNSAISGMIENNSLPSVLESENISAYLQKYSADLSDKINSEVLESTVESISYTLVGLISYAAAFMIIFFVASLAFKILSVILSGIFKLPVLNSINKTLAFLLGIVIAFIYVLIFTAFVQIALPFLSSYYPEYINADVVEKTFIFKYILNFEWLKFLVN